MTTGILNLQPTVESQMKKLSQQKLRRKNAEAKASKVEDDEIEKDAIEMLRQKLWLRRRIPHNSKNIATFVEPTVQ